MFDILLTLFRSICGEFIKFMVRYRLFYISYGLNNTENRKEKVIVSLTSYGRRVSKVVPYTIVSILRQTYKPDKIILWLDSENWNDSNLPAELSKLKYYGLEIIYCSDIKSYTKLIPALEKYPNDIIITCDDDMFYKRKMIEGLIKAYKKNPSRVYCHRAHKPIFNSSGELKPYLDWDIETSDFLSDNVFATGVGGCLYKKSFFYKDICRNDLFMKLAPNADDVWFYFMEVLQKTPRVVLSNSKCKSIYYPLDFFYQYFHKNASLYSSNCLEEKNDLQIKSVMEYYNLKFSDLRNY